MAYLTHKAVQSVGHCKGMVTVAQHQQQSGVGVGVLTGDG